MKHAQTWNSDTDVGEDWQYILEQAQANLKFTVVYFCRAMLPMGKLKFYLCTD